MRSLTCLFRVLRWPLRCVGFLFILLRMCKFDNSCRFTIYLQYRARPILEINVRVILVLGILKFKKHPSLLHNVWLRLSCRVFTMQISSLTLTNICTWRRFLSYSSLWGLRYTLFKPKGLRFVYWIKVIVQIENETKLGMVFQNWPL